MHLLIFIAIVAVVVVLISLLGNAKKTIKREENETLPYVKKPYLMTPAEREFFKVLHLAVQDKYYIVPQVQLSKIVQVSGAGKWQYQYKNRINLKSVDFVLFDKEYFTPEIVIELDDSSHLRPDRQERDTFVDAIMKKTEIKIVHIKNSTKYNVQELKTSLEIV